MTRNNITVELVKRLSEEGCEICFGIDKTFVLAKSLGDLASARFICDMHNVAMLKPEEEYGEFPWQAVIFDVPKDLGFACHIVG